jgi:hypothetical protein
MKSRRMIWTGHVASMEEMRNSQKIWVRKPEGKRPRVRPRRRWEDNIKMDPGDIGRDGVEWLHLAQDRNQWRAL